MHAMQCKPGQGGACGIGHGEIHHHITSRIGKSLQVAFNSEAMNKTAAADNVHSGGKF
jgi:hypothetical protein